MLNLTKKQIIISAAIIFVAVILALFIIVTIVWSMSGGEESEFQDLLDLANSKL